MPRLRPSRLPLLAGRPSPSPAAAAARARAAFQQEPRQLLDASAASPAAKTLTTPLELLPHVQPSVTATDRSPAPAPAALAHNTPARTCYPPPVLNRVGFVPRTAFTTSHSLPKTYFLGHHAKALRQIRDSLSLVHLIIECRDARLPLTTWNPQLEAAAGGRSRIVVYTKTDLLCREMPLPQDEQATRARAARGPHRHRGYTREMRAYQPILEAAAARPAAGLAHEGSVLLQPNDLRSYQKLLAMVKRVALEKDILTGLMAMVVGMPNVGKSTLLNLLRTEGMRGKLSGDPNRKVPKVAKTGQQPGVTRKIGTGVRILDMDPPVYVKDTPGVFVPYMPDPESMVKVALVNGIKANIIPNAVLADYLLYRLNLENWKLYSRFAPGPTNDVLEWLHAVAKTTHMLKPGGLPDLERAAAFMINRFREGRLGRFPLDDLSEEALDDKLVSAANPLTSGNKLRKDAKEERKRLAKAKFKARQSG